LNTKANHFFHVYPDCKESIYILSLTNPNEKVLKVLKVLENQLLVCVQCVTSFYKQLKHFNILLETQYKDKVILTQFNKQVDGWNLNRLIQNCKRLISNFKTNDFSLARKESIPTVYDILNHPHGLENKDFDRLFVTLLMETRRQGSGKLKLQEELYPGILILIAHENSNMRDLGKRSIETSSKLRLIREKDQKEYLPIISAIFNILGGTLKKRNTERFDTRYNLCLDKTELWISFCLISDHISPTRYFGLNSIPFYMNIVDSDRLILNSFVDLKECFWPRIRFLVMIMKNTMCDWMKTRMTTTESNQITQSIVKSVDFIHQCRLEIIDDDGKNDSALAFSWLKMYYQITKDLDWLFVPVKLLSERCNSFSKFARERLCLELEDILKMLDQNQKDRLITLLSSLNNNLFSGIVKSRAFHLLKADLKHFEHFAISNNPRFQNLNVNSEAWKSLDPFKIPSPERFAFIASFLQFRYLGPVDNPEAILNFNPYLRKITEKVSVMIKTLAESVNIEWKSLIPMFLFNNLTLSKTAEILMCCATKTETIQESVERYMSAYGVDLIDFFLGEMKEFHIKVKLGYILLESTDRFLDLINYMFVVFQSSNNYEKNFKLFISITITCKYIFSGCYQWYKSSLCNSTEILLILQKTIQTMKSLISYHNVGLKGKSFEVFNDWVFEVIDAGLRDWIMLRKSEVNYDCFSLVLDLLKVLKGCKLKFEKSILDLVTIYYTKGYVINNDQSVLLKWFVLSEQIVDISDGEYSKKRIGEFDEPASNSKVQKTFYGDSVVRKSTIVTEAVMSIPRPKPQQLPAILPKPTLFAPKIVPRKTQVNESLFSKVKGAALMDARKTKLDQSIIKSQKPVRQEIRINQEDPEDEAPRERRSAQRIDIPGTKPSSSLRSKGGKKDDLVKPISSIVDFIASTLSWDVNDTNPEIPSQQIKQGKVPDSFRSPQQYFNSFEPLLLIELRASFISSCSFLKKQKEYAVVLSALATADNRRSIKN
jgi:hypothetical protein